MYDIRLETWVPPTLVPRPGGFDVLRDGMLLRTAERTLIRVDDGPQVVDGKGRPFYPQITSGAILRYPLATMAVGDSFTVTPYQGRPTSAGFASYVSTKGKALGRKFKVHRTKEGQFEVTRLS